MLNSKKIHFEISERKVLLKVFDVVFVFLSLYLISYFFDFQYIKFSKTNYNWNLVLAIYIYVFGSVFEMYNLQVASSQLQIIKSIILTSSTTVLVYLLTPIYSPFLPSNRLQIVLFYLAIFLSLLIWRSFYVKFLASHRFVKKVILVCDKEQLEELMSGLKNADPHYKIIGYVNSDDSNLSALNTNEEVLAIPLQKLDEYVRNNHVSEIIIASQKTDSITVGLYNQLIQLLENGFIIKEYTQVYEAITHRIPVQYVSRDFYRYFPFSRNNQNQFYLTSVRMAEILVSVFGILIGVLFIPFIFIGNLFGNRGALFYSQERVGKNGSVFKIYKYRTMVQDAEANGAVFSSVNDSRITAFGKFLRKTRLDEFPQFLNILKGDMGIIGPRPERPVFVNEIAEVMPFYETRHIMKPGLTGWAQVNYSYGDSIEDSLIKLQYDLYYIKHRSVFLDIDIIIKTISTVLFYRGQ
ncbi:exopolysaccharide biosynthesis polyprenyl glycosylphosphotransferase [Flavobacterium sp.]|jgi:exopolysaccharide biosynthesis polyprenyl glycosylphosphotransferase|uniref:exopolysaccharide biosynthesis polyprenyl glycosylphosphotransferase n=1 Tax=Flavobacterium sp. TaxID=239 RepID=UPI0037BE8E1E